MQKWNITRSSSEIVDAFYYFGINSGLFRNIGIVIAGQKEGVKRDTTYTYCITCHCYPHYLKLSLYPTG